MSVNPNGLSSESLHREVFGEIRPATSMVQSSALIEPAYVLEIEVDAVIG
jgi:enamine deaminase RidA (YjgF/YER057c/UK114 family)